MPAIKQIQIPSGARPHPRHQMAILLWLVVLAIMTRITLFIRQRTGFTEIDVYAMVEIALVGVTIVLLVASGRVGAALRGLRKTSLLILLGFYVFGGISAVWSPIPDFTLYRAIEMISQIMAVLIALSYCPNFQSAERHFLWVSAIVIVLTMLTPIQFYGWTFSLAARHTNVYSASAAMICCYCVGELMAGRVFRRKMLIIFAIVSLLWMIIGTSSASIIATLCGLAVAAILSRNIKVLIACVFFGLVLAVFLSVSDVNAILFPGKTTDQIEALSGRVMLWDQYIPGIKESPFLGVGFAVVARLGRIYTTNVHNFALAVVAGTGAVGSLIVLAWIVQLIRETWRAVGQRSPGAIGCTAAVVAALVNSMGFDYLGSGIEPTTIVFVCLVAFHCLFVRWVPRAGTSGASVGFSSSMIRKQPWQRRST